MTVASPGMAPGYTFHAHPATFYKAIPGQSLNHILRAGGCITAGIGQIRRKYPLINANQCYEYIFHFNSCNGIRPIGLITQKLNNLSLPVRFLQYVSNKV